MQRDNNSIRVKIKETEMIISKGYRFKSIPMGLDLIIKITKIDYLLNEMSVSWDSKYGQKMTETWNLEHCIWAFERGEYLVIGMDAEEFRTKHGQLEDDGAYADDDL